MKALSNKIKTLHISFQEIAFLKNLSKKNKKILLTSVASFVIITGVGTGIVFFHSNPHSHHQTNIIHQQNVPLAPSIKVANIQLSKKPIVKANPKKTINTDEQIKEIVSIKDVSDQSVKKNDTSLSQTNNTTSTHSIIPISNPATPLIEKPQSSSSVQKEVKTTKSNNNELSRHEERNENDSNKLPVIPISDYINQSIIPNNIPQSIIPISSIPSSTLPQIPLATSSSQENSNKKNQTISKQEEISVLNLLTREATLVRDMKNEIISLKQQQQIMINNNHDSETKMYAEIEDLKRRISMQEASKAITAASETSIPHESSTVSSSNTEAIKVVSYGTNTTKNLRKSARKKRKLQNNTNKNSDYNIQAASPDIAMLTASDGKHLQVGINSEIPGYGHVKKISQKGTAWFIVTEKGIIQ